MDNNGEAVAASELYVVGIGASAGGLEAFRLLLAELPVKSAVKLAAEITGGSRNELYDQALALKKAG